MNSECCCDKRNPNFYSSHTHKNSRARNPSVSGVGAEESDVLHVVSHVVTGCHGGIPGVQGLHHASGRVQVTAKYVSAELHEHTNMLHLNYARHVTMKFTALNACFSAPVLSYVYDSRTHP